ncbi:disulfide bond formation protein B [Temperatibacter marinus]|uniref:Disulfide bond formation protein B n=1 Tax=Temperatibacter marinus TaxID=1456591 RepID=A0AA52HA13_9PROT|nr:disulfide bond formation protein B [Temperatibacter marinus]WND03756.1 disulfide bond formation protein B [Temperatibacter marinus]
MKKTLVTFLTDQPALAATGAGLLTLLAAFISEYGFGYHPCEMCWWQRYPYMVAGSLFLAFASTGKTQHKSLLLLLMLIFMVNTSLAFFHVGVEEKWWEGITTCAGSAGQITLESIQNAPLIRCDEIQFSLLGISMAGYNFLIALSLTVFCGHSFLRRHRHD